MATKMTREAAIKIVQSATVWTDEEKDALAMLIPELAESEDEKKMIFLERLIEHNVPDGQYGWVDGMKGGFVTKSEAISMLKSLRPQPSWKPSEQEKGALRTAIYVLTEERNFPKAAANLQAILDAFDGKESRKDWKPSDVCYGIKGDPDPAGVWKPSEEQMKALHRSIYYLHGEGYEYSDIQSLYEQLKKL